MSVKSKLFANVNEKFVSSFSYTTDGPDSTTNCFLTGIVTVLDLTPLSLIA